MKKKYSTLLNFALAGCLATTLAACGSDGDKTNGSNIPGAVNQSGPIISIGGTVLDTNGNPMGGTTVSCQGTQAVTNTSGQWIIHELQVNNTAGLAEDTAQSYNAVRCVVEAPVGYLGAVVSVTPEAQMDSMWAANGWNSAFVDSIEFVPIVTFIDGLYAEAGTAWLPMLGSTIYGRLERCESEEGIAGAIVKLDMQAVDNNDVETQAGSACQYGCSVDYSTAMYSATTGLFGEFAIANVPNDSILRLFVENYTNISMTGKYELWDSVGDEPDSTPDREYLTTVDEGIVNLGDICADPITVGDGTRPCVSNIEGWVQPIGYWDEGTIDVDSPWFDDELEVALLNDNIDGTDGIDIYFNETLLSGQVNENSVVVWDNDEQDYITDFSTSLTGNALTLTTTDPIPADHHILVYLLRDDFQDLAGNYLHAYEIVDFLDRSPTQGPNVCEDVFFAEEFYSINHTPYVVVGFKIHSPDNTDVDAATDLAQECTDYSESVADQTALQGEYPTVFRSELESDNDFYNLNADPDYEYRLEALADVLECPVDDTSEANIINNYASVSFVAPTGGAWEISSPSGPHEAYCTDNCDGLGDGSAEISVMYDADIGDIVCVDSYDDFANLSAQTCTTLGDCVAPTTVLNFAYNTCGHLGQSYDSWETNNTEFHDAGPGADGPGYDTDYAAHLCVDFEAATLAEFGDGGENTNEGTPGVCGIPTLNITCRLLKDPADAALGGVVEPIQFYGLYTGGADGQIPAPGAYGPFPDFALYDATEFEAWVPFADTIGVAFSENIAITAGGAIGGSIAWEPSIITSWTVGNNIGTTDDGDTPDGGPDADDTDATSTTVDLVQITVADVLSLANDNHQEIMDFSLAVEDLAGLPADNARVVVNDLMPPFVEYAYWDGGLTVKFNESVAPCIDGVTTLSGVDCFGGSDTIVLWDINGNHDPVSLDGATLSDIDGGTDNLLEIPAINLAAITGDENFPATTDTTYALVYDEDIYDDLGFTGPYQHGGMTWGAIPDARGNTWADYDSAAHGTVLYRDVDGTELCNMPSFAVADVLGPFTVTGIGVSNFTDGAPATCSGSPGSTGTMVAAVNHVMTYSFSHPLNLERQYWEDQDLSGSIDCTAASATDLCTLAEVNNGMTNGAWVDDNVIVCSNVDCTEIVGNVSYLTGVSAHLNDDRMSMTVTVQNNATQCYTWETNDYLLPVWNVWSAYNVGTFKQLNLQGVP